jgi:hypothetical protein
MMAIHSFPACVSGLRIIVQNKQNPYLKHYIMLINNQFRYDRIRVGVLFKAAIIHRLLLNEYNACLLRSGIFGWVRTYHCLPTVS